MSEPLIKAIKIVGSRQKVIRKLGITRQRLNSWLNNDVMMAYEYAMALEYLTHGQVKASELVPERVEVLKKLKIPSIPLPSWLLKKRVSLTGISQRKYSSESIENIQELALDIQIKGLLQPIAIDSKGTLIFGKRRLQACIWLRRKIIDVYEIALSALVHAPGAGNLLQKYFKLSERVAIGMALEGVLGKRQGKRNDLQLLQNFAEVTNKSSAREKVASIIGLNNGETYRQAKKIVQHGICPLIEALDNGDIRIYAAYEISVFPLANQYPLLEAYYQKMSAKKQALASVGQPKKFKKKTLIRQLDYH